MTSTYRKQKGFTIVELLIVIVVIGILAAITIVAYNGVQQRALNTARISSAKHGLQLLQMYKTLHGEYPAVPVGTVVGTSGACLGTGWPVVEGRAVCWNMYTDGAGPGASTFFQDDGVNNALSTVGNLPDYPEQIVRTMNDSNGRPLKLNALALIDRTGTGNSFFELGNSLAYILSGDTDCGLSGAVKSDLAGSTRCVVHLN